MKNIKTLNPRTKKIILLVILITTIVFSVFKIQSILNMMSLQKEIENYIIEIGEINKKQTNTFLKLNGGFMNEENGFEAFELLDKEIIPEMENIIEETQDIKVKNKELKEINTTYVKALEGQLEVVSLYKKGIKEENESLIVEANGKITYINDAIKEYEKNLNKFALKNRLEINFEPSN